MLIQYHSPKQPFRTGRRPKRTDISQQQARQIARSISPSPLTRSVIDALATAGVLTLGQLQALTDISGRHLRRLYQQYVVDRLPLDPETQSRLADLLEANRSECIVYFLGPVGLEIVKAAGRTAPGGYTGFGTSKIIHDVMAAEVVIRLARDFQEAGWETLWLGRHEASVLDERGRVVLEPDALLVLRQGEKVARFVLEFHNESQRGYRAAEKVERYERAYRDGHWRDSWQTDTMPPILAVFTSAGVGKGYMNAVQAQSRLGLRNRFLGKSWEEFGEKHSKFIRPSGHWFDFRESRFISLMDLLPRTDEEQDVEEE